MHSGNLQADETPVKYLDPGKGKTSTGYLWVIHAPRNGIKGDILYQWHTSRKAACLDELLGNYQGNLQTDAYAGYTSWTAGKDGIDLSSCWAHARREFHEALKIGQRLAAGPIAIIAEALSDRNRTARAKRHGAPSAPPSADNNPPPSSKSSRANCSPCASTRKSCPRENSAAPSTTPSPSGTG